MAPIVKRNFTVVNGSGIFLVEQNARLALEVCQRGYVMESGRITLEATTDVLATAPRVRAAYLGE